MNNILDFLNRFFMLGEPKTFFWNLWSWLICTCIAYLFIIPCALLWYKYRAKFPKWLRLSD